MDILSWIAVGLIAGALAGRVTGAKEGRGCLGTIVIGILGALLGGALFRLGTGNDIDDLGGFNPTSLVVAFVGAVALLLVLQVLGVEERRR